MFNLSGENWSGQVQTNESISVSSQRSVDFLVKARGQYKGYAWYLQVKNSVWHIEIAEDYHVQPDELPLVGFGYAGWIYESRDVTPNEKEPLLAVINRQLEQFFDLFSENKLSYIPAITCCND